MRASEKRELFEKVKAACAVLGVKNIAPDIDKGYGTLLNELNADDPHHKLGLETFVDLLDVLGSEKHAARLRQAVLDWLVARYGFAFFPLKQSPAEDLSRLLHKLDKEVEDIAHAFLRATDPNSHSGDTISEEERREIAQEAREATTIIQQIHSHLC